MPTGGELYDAPLLDLDWGSRMYCVCICSVIPGPLQPSAEKTHSDCVGWTRAKPGNFLDSFMIAYQYL